MASIRFRGREDVARLSAALDNAPNNLRRELVTGLKAAARPAVRDIKAAIRSADVSGQPVTGRRVRIRRDGTPVVVPIRRFRAQIPSRGLRGPIARAVDSQVSTLGDGARVDLVLKMERVPVRIRKTVKYVAGSRQRWRHPIMGKKPDGTWRGGAGQNAPNVWWKTVKPHIPRFNREVAGAVQRTEERLRQEAG